MQENAMVQGKVRYGIHVKFTSKSFFDILKSKYLKFHKMLLSTDFECLAKK